MTAKSPLERMLDVVADRRSDPTKRSGWAWNLDGTERVLYNWPSVAEAVAKGFTIYKVEGEKDVDTLAAAGYVATTAPGGKGGPKNDYNWRPQYADVLRGA